jgi:hypothetical protein
LRHEATTGLTPTQFDELVRRVDVQIEWDCGVGRPPALTLRQAVKATVMYFRTNVTEEVIAELLFVDQSTVSRAIGDLEVVITQVLEEFVPDLAQELPGRVGVVDGSLTPCWSWADEPTLYSGKHHRTGHNHQFVADINGYLLHISDPLPGSTHDAKAITETGIAALLDPGNCLGDKGYIGTGPVTPFRKPPGGHLLDWQKEFNTAINKSRYVIERAIANFKTWRCMHTDYRRPLDTYPHAFNAVRALHFYKLRSA